MNVVVAVEPGVIEVNFTWLPMWLGMDSRLIKELGDSIGPALVGLPIEEAESKGHDLAVDFLVARHPEILGLRAYLDALRGVSFQH